MSEEQLMKEIIKEQAQKIIHLEQYLRIEKEVSDETIKELEQQITELKESQKQKQIIKLCERLDEAKQQNEQMLNTLKEITDYLTPNNKNYIGCKSILHIKVDETIESVTGKPIEEATK